MRVLVLSKYNDIWENFTRKNSFPSHAEVVLVRDPNGDIPPHPGEIIGIPPFIYARNVNLGLCDDNILLCNDDIEGLTAEGVNTLEHLMNQNLKTAILAPQVEGLVCCEEQRVETKLPDGPPHVINHNVAFVCTLISGLIVRILGGLDERFIGYGYDDTDYCHRAFYAGFDIAITDKVKIKHKGSISFTRKYGNKLENESQSNRRLFDAKWNVPIPIPSDWVYRNPVKDSNVSEHVRCGDNGSEGVRSTKRADEDSNDPARVDDARGRRAANPGALLH